jgi:putative membrane protein
MIQRKAVLAAAAGLWAFAAAAGATSTWAQQDNPEPPPPPPATPEQQPSEPAPVTPTTPVTPQENLPSPPGKPRPAGEQKAGAGQLQAHDPAALSARDRTFMKNAAQSNVAEVLTGQLALQRADSASVRQLAQMLISEHGQANAQLKQVAAQHRFTLPGQPGPRQKALFNRLARLSGAAFDRAYLSGQIQSHLQSIALYQNQIRGGKDEHAVGYARATLPRIQNHTGMIVQVAEGIGVRAPQQARAYRRPAAPSQEEMRMYNNRGVGGNSGNTLRRP